MSYGHYKKLQLNDRIYFKFCMHNNYHCSANKSKEISLQSGRFPHKIYCWINVHPTITKIIHPRIYFLEQKQNYIPMENKVAIS